MKSLLLSAVLGLGTLGGLLASAAPAQAGPLLWFLVARRVVLGPPYAGYYYDPGYGYDYGPYPAPPPAATTVPAPAAAPAPNLQTWSANYGPGQTGRYVYYTSNGWQMCFDRQTGEYWYQDPATREWQLWTR